MLAEYSFYHGAFLHEVVLRFAKAIVIEACDSHGRPNAFILNSKLGVLLKHSKKRLSPWIFNFTKEHLVEVRDLCEQANSVYGCFICGDDGIACVPVAAFIPLLGSTETEQAWLRFDRRANEMYRVSGSNGELSTKLARGVDELVHDLDHLSLQNK